MQTSPLKFTRAALAALLFSAAAIYIPFQGTAQTRLGIRTGAAAAQKATAPYSQPVGLYGGVFLEKSLSQKSVLRPELNVMMMRSKYTVYNGAQRQQKTLMQYRVQVPVLLSLEVLPHIWVLAGPQLNYSISDLPVQPSNPDVKSSVHPPLTLGAAAGLMAKTNDGVEISLRAGYSSGWSSHLPSSTAERVTWSAGLGFPISGFNSAPSRNVSNSKFPGSSYQIPGE